MNQLDAVTKVLRALPDGGGTSHMLHVLALRPSAADLLLVAAKAVTANGGTVDYPRGHTP